MAFQTWETLVNAYQYSGSNVGTVLENTETLTAISPGAETAGKQLVIPANYLNVGSVIRYSATGIFSTTGTPTLILGIYYGGVAGVVLAETIAITTPSGGANLSWALEAISRVKEVGSTGKIYTQGWCRGVEAKSLTSTTAGTTMMPEETSTGGESASLNTGENKSIVLGAKWGTASTSNKITCYQWLVEILN
jgi:hypothetical protein